MRGAGSGGVRGEGGWGHRVRVPGKGESLKDSCAGGKPWPICLCPVFRRSCPWRGKATRRALLSAGGGGDGGAAGALRSR